MTTANATTEPRTDGDSVGAAGQSGPAGCSVGISPWGTDGDYRWAAFRTGRPIAYGVAQDRSGATLDAAAAIRAAAWAGTH